jgi:hypothetical protein
MSDKTDNLIRASVEGNSLNDEARALLVRAGSSDMNEAYAAQHAIAVQAGEVIREGVVDGDIHSDIFFMEDFTNTTFDGRIDLDLLAPGTEKEHIAYVMPDHGKIPHRFVESDYIMLSTYSIVNSIDVTLKYFRNARFDILRRMLEVLRAGFVKKKNDDCWQTLVSAGNGRGIVVYDSDATAGVFTPKLTSLMKTVMRRNGGGNSTSMNRRRLTDLYVSPEALEDMSAWGLNLVPDSVREQIYRSEDGAISDLFGVTYHDIDELGVGQEYQLYFTGTLSGSLAASDVELVVGLDLTARDKAFLMPVEENLQVFEDNTLHRSGLAGFYGMETYGCAVLDTRFVLLGSF